MQRILLPFLLAAYLTGCATRDFSAYPQFAHKVEERPKYTQEVIEIPNVVSVLVPGFMRGAEPVTFAAGPLLLVKTTDTWKYFCAKEGFVASDFNGYSTLMTGSCAGIRVSINGQQWEWFVDTTGDATRHGVGHVHSKPLIAQERLQYTVTPPSK